MDFLKVGQAFNNRSLTVWNGLINIWILLQNKDSDWCKVKHYNGWRCRRKRESFWIKNVNKVQLSPVGSRRFFFRFCTGSIKVGSNYSNGGLAGDSAHYFWERAEFGRIELGVNGKCRTNTDTQDRQLCKVSEIAVKVPYYANSRTRFNRHVRLKLPHMCLVSGLPCMS